MYCGNINKWIRTHRDVLRFIGYVILALCILAFLATSEGRFWIILSFLGSIAYCLVLTDINSMEREKQELEKENENLRSTIHNELAGIENQLVGLNQKFNEKFDN